jgi:peptide/nickel transport system permease protein
MRPSIMTMRGVRPRVSWHARLCKDALPLAVLVAFCIVGVIGPWMTGWSGQTPDLPHMLQAPSLHGGDGAFLLGTDNLGRSVLARLLEGARVSLIVAVTAASVGLVIGAVAGVAAGYLGGWTDRIVMRLLEGTLALPYILIAIVVAVVVGQGLVRLSLVLGLLSWAQYARVIRSETQRIRELPYIVAERVIGASTLRIVALHVVPAMQGTLYVLFSLQLGAMIVYEAALSFLGIGVPEPYASWGTMLAEARPYMDEAWWLIAFPGAALGLVILSFNVVGNWIRERYDPLLSRGIAV